MCHVISWTYLIPAATGAERVTEIIPERRGGGDDAAAIASYVRPTADSMVMGADIFTSEGCQRANNVHQTTLHKV